MIEDMQERPEASGPITRLRGSAGDRDQTQRPRPARPQRLPALEPVRLTKVRWRYSDPASTAHWSYVDAQHCERNREGYGVAKPDDCHGSSCRGRPETNGAENATLTAHAASQKRTAPRSLGRDVNRCLASAIDASTSVTAPVPPDADSGSRSPAGSTN